MSKQEIVTEIKKALESLNVHGHVRLNEITPGDTMRVIVYVNDEYFGIYDTYKHTFVD